MWTVNLAELGQLAQGFTQFDMQRSCSSPIYLHKNQFMS